MSREELESVYCLKNELKMWQNKLAKLQEEMAVSPKVMDGMPYPNTNEVSSPTERIAIEIIEVDTIIKGMISKIRITIKEITEFITGIEDSEMRQIINHRCVDCMKWERIGEEMGYDRTTVSKKYNAFLDEMFPTNPTRK